MWWKRNKTHSAKSVTPTGISRAKNQQIPLSETSENLKATLLNALWPTQKLKKHPWKRKTEPHNDTQKIHKGDINEYSENDQWRGIRNWGNACYMISALQILNDMDRPQEQENLNIKQLLNTWPRSKTWQMGRKDITSTNWRNSVISNTTERNAQGRPRRNYIRQ